jgi:hypothetical protein
MHEEVIGMTKPTHEDATIMLQLAQWGAAIGLSEAMNWMWSDEFVTDADGFWAKYPTGSEGARKLLTIGNYCETLGTLWKQGLLNEGLIFDWLAVSMVWARVKDCLLHIRLESGNRRMYENFEALANAESAYDAAKADAYLHQRDKPAFYGRALAVAEAKYWGRPSVPRTPAAGTTGRRRGTPPTR